MAHEQKLFKQLKEMKNFRKNKIAKVKFGNADIEVKMESFKLVELDSEDSSTPCTVCPDGLDCSFRTFRLIASSFIRIFNGVGGFILGPNVIKDALKLENWQFNTFNAVVTIDNPVAKDKSKILSYRIDGPDFLECADLLIHYYTYFGDINLLKDRCRVCLQKAKSDCSRCKLVVYCCSAHQIYDWDTH